jgi:hypothetical protein
MIYLTALIVLERSYHVEGGDVYLEQLFCVHILHHVSAVHLTDLGM